eukprot:768235-Hanusia_phi.AAC.1
MKVIGCYDKIGTLKVKSRKGETASDIRHCPSAAAAPPCWLLPVAVAIHIPPQSPAHLGEPSDPVQ